MRITDRARVIADGERVRIDGFYTINTRPNGLRAMIPVLPEDPRLEVIGTYALCGRFHRPWELTHEGPVCWSDRLIAEEIGNWADKVVRGTTDLTSTGYPELFAHFPPLSNHERLMLAGWRHAHFPELAA